MERVSFSTFGTIGNDEKIVSRTKKESSFKEFLVNEIENLNNTVKKAEGKIVKIASGESNDILGAVAAMVEAELSVKAAVQIRNKVVQTYQTLIHMQV